MIDESFIKNVLDHADIVSIIGQYIPLSKKGSDYKGLCPFHKDSNPSLSVTPAKKVFKCFACGEAGNAIQFIQKYKHVSFMESLQEVAATAGITVPLNSAQSKKMAILKRYQEIMDDTTSFYQFCLYQTKDGQAALNYLHHRQLNDDVINHFKIGLAPKDHDKLFTYLTHKDILELDLIKLGLVKQDDNGQYYDYFRQRITFPLDDLNGRTVGFSARIYETESNSKYLNSSENDLFHKGSLLYHYQEASKSASLDNHIYLFEGFMDVIACYRAGITNTVASMGTSLTEHQIEAILKLTSNVTIIYDGDNAGIEATRRAIMLFKQAGITPTACLFPDGMDPDEYINAYGDEALRNYIKTHTQSPLDYLYDSYLLSYDLTHLDEADNFLNMIFRCLKDFNSPLYVSTAFKRLEKDLGLKEEVLTEKYNNFTPEPVANPSNKTVSSLQEPYDNFIPPVEEPYYAPINDYPSDNIKNDNKLLINKYHQAEERLVYVECLDKTWAIKIESKLKDQYVDFDLYQIRKAILQEYNVADLLNDKMIEASLGTELMQKLDAIRNNSNYAFGSFEGEQGWYYITDLTNKVVEYFSIKANPTDGKDKLKNASKKKKITVKIK